MLGLTPTVNSLSVAPAFVTKPVSTSPTSPTTIGVSPLAGPDGPETSTWGLVLTGLGIVFLLRRKLAVN
jgi:MYXO-CTERM domain-containing protein